MPWSGLSTPLPSPLKIGIMMTDGVMTPQPPVTRALKWAHSQLTSHPCSSNLFQLKPFLPYNCAEAMKHIRQMYWPDGGTQFRAACLATGEPMHLMSEHLILDAETATGKPGAGQELPASAVSAQRYRHDQFRIAFARSWQEQDVDVVLYPVFMGPACAHDMSFYWNYTALWNFVDYPGVVVPTPVRAEKDKERYEDGGEGVLGEEDKHVGKLWEEADFVGAPIDLQVVAYRYHDSLLFGEDEGGFAVVLTDGKFEIFKNWG